MIKEQLMTELVEMRQRIAELKKLEAKLKKIEKGIIPDGEPPSGLKIHISNTKKKRKNPSR